MLWNDWNIKWKTTETADKESVSSAPAMLVGFADEAALNEGRPVLHPALDGEVRDRAACGLFSGKPGEAELMPALGLIPEKYAVYAGCESVPASAKSLREAAGSIGKFIIDFRIRKAVFVIPEEWLNDRTEEQCSALASALMEGLLLGIYRRKRTSDAERNTPLLEEAEFRLGEPSASAAWKEGLRLGYETANAVCYARELTNEPSNRLTPARMAQEALELAASHGFECRIYDENDADEAGMGGLLAVGRGSANPPRMIVLRYRGNPESAETLGLIGKGVTFDTGGISLKKAEGMEEMISDMGGAAAVLGAMRAIGVSKPAANVVAVVAAAENMPSGSAFKPGDVIRTYSGKTVEVLNTDAEGRIVLADGLTTAIRHGATKLIDVATLTGAIMHALGDWATGAFSNDEPTLRNFLDSARSAGEYVWPMPTFPEYRRLLKSDAADLKNHGGAWAGAIAGALFVGEFAEGLPWIHLDIGGTAWMWSDRGFEAKGGTGVMVRSLIEYIRHEAKASR